MKTEVVALDGVSLESSPARFRACWAYGAGKSTTIGILTTRVQPTGGRAFIGEFDVWREPVRASGLSGWSPSGPNLDFGPDRARNPPFPPGATSAKAPASAPAAPAS